LIIDRYLIRLVLAPTLAGFALLILLVSAFNAAALLRDAAYSRIPISQVFTVIGLRNVIAAEVLLPTSLYMGVLTTLNQWHREREAFALYGAGMVPGRAAYPVWSIALIVCLCVAALSLYARPWAYAESYRLDAATDQLSTEAMQPDHFYTFGGSIVLSAASIDRAADTMHNVFMQTKDAHSARVIRSQSGRIFGAQGNERQRIELRQGVSYAISEDSRADKMSEFDELVYYAPPQEIAGVRDKRRASATASLVIATSPKERAELQWRICLPVIAFFMTLIAVEISRAMPGSSPYPRFIAGIAVYALVFNVAAAGRTWVENGQIGAMPGMLWVPVATAALFLVVRQLPSVSLRRPG
jgi:lipopolysaccharide export system permease protein